MATEEVATATVEEAAETWTRRVVAVAVAMVAAVKAVAATALVAEQDHHLYVAMLQHVVAHQRGLQEAVETAGVMQVVFHLDAIQTARVRAPWRTRSANSLSAGASGQDRMSNVVGVVDCCCSFCLA